MPTRSKSRQASSPAKVESASTASFDPDKFRILPTEALHIRPEWDNPSLLFEPELVEVPGATLPIKVLKYGCLLQWEQLLYSYIIEYSREQNYSEWEYEFALIFGCAYLLIRRNNKDVTIEGLFASIDQDTAAALHNFWIAEARHHKASDIFEDNDEPVEAPDPKVKQPDS